MKNILLIGLCLLLPYFSQSQTKDYKVVFDLTSKDTIDQSNVMRWIREITGSDPNAKLEVVLYGKSLDMIVKSRSLNPDGVARMLANKNVSFKVCAIAMKNQNIDKSELIAGVEIVPDGIYEIITKQQEGWGYIKAAR